MKPKYILTLSDPIATLDNVGGKGMSLAKMLNAGFPVPDGFHVTTEAYRAFVDANDLQTRILAALKDADPSLPASLETTSALIGKFFADVPIPKEIATAITDAYADLNRKLSIENRKSVAVRSSATAEDLPEASFAGQQETYLNVHGEEDLLSAVKKCWASLWTARAIAYRIRNNIDQKAVALAVVVQEMVDADAAGILFTANPINGRRDEMVINAAWGLGEAIVGGLVSPDTIVADKVTGKIKSYEVAEKTVITVKTEHGTREEPLNDSRRSSKVLKEAQVSELVNIAYRIESHYGRPQDIEWCRAGDRFLVVQSRPITAMAEIPIEWTLPNPKGIYMRTSIADLMPSPLSPLFASWAMPTLTDQMKPLCIRLGLGEPVWPEEFYTSINRYAYMNAAYPLKTWWWMLVRMLPAYPRLLRNMVPIWRDELLPEYQEFVGRYQAKDIGTTTTIELWQDAQAILGAAMYYAGGLLYATMGASAGSEGLLTQVYNKFAKREGDPEASVLLMGWNNIAVRSEKSLYDLAMWATEHDGVSKYLLETPTAELVTQIFRLPQGEVAKVMGWDEFVSQFQTYLEKFGHLVFQMDFAESLPREHPELLLETIKMYLHSQGINPHERQQASEAKRIQTMETMRNRLKGFKRWAFIKALNWGQSMAEVREDALAGIGLGYPSLRAMLHELGNRFVTAGVIQQADDIYWLEKAEVEVCVHNLEQGSPLDNLLICVEERKDFNKKAGQMIPPPMMPMKKKFLGIDTKVWLAESESNRIGNILKGVPSSAGKVTAPARVLRGPEDFGKMRAGEVLVAGTTTPAWTPLFAMASAVVTDIGGPLSHGSIVAREYGIPAVMGTGVATRRIQSGQVITVDGTKGEVILETSKEGQTEEEVSSLEQKLPHSKAALPPEPAQWIPPDPKGMYARGSLCEHLPNPVSPLFGTLGIRMVNIPTREIGEMALGVGGGGYQYRTINGYVFLGMVLTWREWLSMAKATSTLTRSMFKISHEYWQAGRKEFISALAVQDAKDVKSLSPTPLLNSARELMLAIGKFYTVIQASTLPSASTSEIVFTRAYKIASRKDDPKAETLLFGLETTPLRAEKSLFNLGMWTRERPALCDFTLQTSTRELVAALQADSAPKQIPAEDWSEFKNRFQNYLDEFGHTTYEFDFMNPTPAETPGVILDALKLFIEGKGSDPYARQQEATRLREVTLQKIRSRFKLIPNRWFDKATNWALRVGPDREDSIADLGMGHTTLRRFLGELGKRFAAHGAIQNSDDIYWLVEDEVSELASLLEQGGRLPEYSSRIPERKSVWHERMKFIPPAMLPEKSFWAKLLPWNRNTTGDALTGVASSAGRVTGTACVLLGPEDFSRMKPGLVLVAVTTTPAWTPLFVQASAIVTDLGGPLSHSSIVAREYGIPAVVATGVGTHRIKDGQTIIVDGSAGTVELK